MRIMIVTDAWFPQTNGVVNTLAQTAAWLVRFGHEVMITAPRDYDLSSVADVARPVGSARYARSSSSRSSSLRSGLKWRICSRTSLVSK